MTDIPRNASDEDVLEVVMSWVDVLATRDYESVANSLGYIFGKPTAETIRMAIEGYRSQEFFPGVESFAVTRWREAIGGNPAPMRRIVWFEENEALLAAAISIHLPLNGKWSDLCADFILVDREPDAGTYRLRLEEIFSPIRPQ